MQDSIGVTLFANDPLDLGFKQGGDNDALEPILRVLRFEDRSQLTVRVPNS